MARSMIVNFPPASTTVLYPTSVAGGGATSAIPLAIPYPVQFPAMTRKITFTSTDDLSGINFTISGLDGFGNAISEVIAGPGIGTVTSVNLYNIISAIASSGNYTNFSIGYGSTGITTWLSLNDMNTYPSYTVQAAVYGTINYSLVQTAALLQFYKPVGPYYQFMFPKRVALAPNPLATADGTAVVTVAVPSTGGLVTGDIVTIQGAATTNTITPANLNISAVITVVDATHFSYTAGANAGPGAAGGGANVSYYFPSLPTASAIDASLTAATATQFFASTKPATAVQLIVNSSTAPATLTLTLLQQGIN